MARKRRGMNNGRGSRRNFFCRLGWLYIINGTSENNQSGPSMMTELSNAKNNGHKKRKTTKCKALLCWSSWKVWWKQEGLKGPLTWCGLPTNGDSSVRENWIRMKRKWLNSHSGHTCTQDRSLETNIQKTFRTCFGRKWSSGENLGLTGGLDEKRTWSTLPSAMLGGRKASLSVKTWNQSRFAIDEFGRDRI